MAKTVSKILVDLRDECIASFKEMEAKAKPLSTTTSREPIFNGAYRKTLLDECDAKGTSEKRKDELLAMLDDESTGSIYPILTHVFNTMYFTTGIDILEKEEKYKPDELRWLVSRLETLQKELSVFARNLALVYLSSLGQDCSKLTREQADRLLESAEQNDQYKNQLDFLKNWTIGVCQRIQKMIDQSNIALSIPQTAITIKAAAADEKSNPLLAAGSDFAAPVAADTKVVSSGTIFNVNGPNFNPFLFSYGFSHPHHANLTLLIFSPSYSNGVAMRQMADCCESLCTSSHSNLSYHGAHLITSAYCCASSGSGGGHSNCNCSFDCFRAGGAGVMGVGGIGSVAAGGATNTTAPNTTNGLHAILTGAHVGATHTEFLSTENKYLASVIYAAVAGTKIVGNLARPIYTLYKHPFKSYEGRCASIRLATQLAVASAFAIPTYLMSWGGPHSALAAAGTGTILGDMLAENRLEKRARNNFNGESNPETWILNSTVLRGLIEKGVEPQKIYNLLLEIKKLLTQAKNNRNKGAKFLDAWWGMLPACAKEEIEIALGETVTVIKTGEVDSIEAQLAVVNAACDKVYGQNAVTLFLRPRANPSVEVSDEKSATPSLVTSIP